MKRPDRWTDDRGYVRLKRPKKLYPGGFVYEHRAVMEQILGRPLLPSEDVHHRNHVRSDNRPENLELYRSRGVHVAHHNSVDPKRKRGVPPKPKVAPTPRAQLVRANKQRSAKEWLRDYWLGKAANLT